MFPKRSSLENSGRESIKNEFWNNTFLEKKMFYSDLGCCHRKIGEVIIGIIASCLTFQKDRFLFSLLET